MTKHVIIYARKPEAHKSKTRLGASIGYQQAAGVYARLLFSYLEDLLRSEVLKSVCFTLSVADPESEAFFAAAYPELRVVRQVEAGLGERMQNSFEDVYALGAEAAVLTGSDIPFLGASQVAETFRILENNDLVLGPAEDGGYFLVGMRRPGWNVFEGIPWSTKDVLAKTMEKTDSLGLNCEYLPLAFDLDVEADYHRWIEIISNGGKGDRDGKCRKC